MTSRRVQSQVLLVLLAFAGLAFATSYAMGASNTTSPTTGGIPATPTHTNASTPATPTPSPNTTVSPQPASSPAPSPWPTIVILIVIVVLAVIIGALVALAGRSRP